MKKNAKLAPLQTPLRQVAIFLHNADFPHLRVTKLPPDSPAERCCFALAIGCVRENGWGGGSGGVKWKESVVTLDNRM